MNAFKFNEPLVLKLMNKDVLSVTYLGQTDEGWFIVRPLSTEDSVPANSELYIEPSNIAWVAKRDEHMAQDMDSELLGMVSH